MLAQEKAGDGMGFLLSHQHSFLADKEETLDESPKK
jgi:hypothetical protein